MKYFYILVICCLSATRSLADDVRVMTYNIRHGAGMDNVLDLERTAKVIERCCPDFVALQEVDSCARRSKNVDQVAELGRLTLMRGTYAAAIPLQGGKYGVALLSKERPITVRRIAMPSRSEDRVLLVCEFSKCVIACTHLSLLEDEHNASADTIVNEALRWNKPFIIMGDWNSHPDSPFIKRIRQHFSMISDNEVPTFPADKPKETLDYIAVLKATGAEMAVRKSFEVVEEKTASDHRPLVADLALKTPGGKLMTHEPYLQDPRPDRMTVMFQTDAVCHAWVEYGTDSIHTQRARTIFGGQEVCYDIENKIVLHNLKPGHEYYYRVCLVGLTYKRAYETHFGDTLTTRFYKFRTPSDNDTDFTALVFNDLHQNSKAYEALLKKTAGIDYDFVIFNGDCLPEPRDRAHAIRMIHNVTDPVGGAEKPVIFIRGNHEIRDFYSVGMHSLIGYRDGLTYGAFNWGDTRFVVLDLGEDKPDDTWVYYGLNDFTSLRNDQVRFLKEELRSRDFRKAARHILVSHIPVFANTDKYQPCTELFGSLLKGQPFDLALCAHVHETAFFEKGTVGASFPIFRGGGPSVEDCSVAVLTKRGKKLELSVLTPEGQLLSKTL